MPDPALDLDFARWARARDDYRAGLTAAEVCARHQIGRSAFYARAQAERWRRADLRSDACASPQGDDFEPARPRPAASEIAEQAHRRLAHAVGKGRLREALGWSRLARDLRALAEAEESANWRRLRAAQRETEAQAPAESAAEPAEAPAQPDSSLDGGGGAVESPAPLRLQAPDPIEEAVPSPDCPDSFRESAEGSGEGDLDALPREVLIACREVMDREPDPDRAWAAILPLLVAARPDIGWCGEDVEDEPFDEEEPEPPP